MSDHPSKDLNSVPDAMLTPHGKELAKAQRTSNPVTDLFLAELIDRYDAAPGAHWCGRAVVDCLRELQKRRADETSRKQPDWETEYKKLAGVYSRTGLEEFIAKHWPGNKLVDVSAVEPKAELPKDYAEVVFRVEVASDTDEKVETFRQQLCDAILAAPAALRADVMVTTHREGQLSVFETNRTPENGDGKQNG